jgi:hypothetical protein
MATMLSLSSAGGFAVAVADAAADGEGRSVVAVAGRVGPPATAW